MAEYNTLLPLAILTVMMFLIWSDSIRPRGAHPIAYGARALLFVGATAILLYNRIRFPHLYTGAATLFIAIAVLVGIGGAIYFGRKLMR